MPSPIGAPVPSARPIGTHAGADIRRPSLDEGAADTGAHHAPKAPSPHRADAPASSGGGSGTISSTTQHGAHGEAPPVVPRHGARHDGAVRQELGLHLHVPLPPARNAPHHAPSRLLLPCSLPLVRPRRFARSANFTALVRLPNRPGWRSKSARAAVVPEIRVIAEAKRTSVREPPGSREGRVPRPAAASARSAVRRTAEPRSTPPGAPRCRA